MGGAEAPWQLQAGLNAVQQPTQPAPYSRRAAVALPQAANTPTLLQLSAGQLLPQPQGLLPPQALLPSSFHCCHQPPTRRRRRPGAATAMGAGWRRFTERLHQAGPTLDRSFSPTPNTRCAALLREAGSFAGQLRKCERAVRAMAAANVEAVRAGRCGHVVRGLAARRRRSGARAPAHSHLSSAAAAASPEARDDPCPPPAPCPAPPTRWTPSER